MKQKRAASTNIGLYFSLKINENLPSWKKRFHQTILSCSKNNQKATIRSFLGEVAILNESRSGSPPSVI